MKKISLLTLALVLGLSVSAFAWSGHGSGHRSGHSNTEHGGYMQNNNASYEQHGGGHERAANNATVHDAEMKNPNHSDPINYTAPHRMSSSCDGMTGPHGRHISN